MEEEINSQPVMNTTKKTVLILLTIFILGPLIFVGACFPIGLFTFSVNSGGILIAIIIGLALAILICSLIIKKIKNH